MRFSVYTVLLCLCSLSLSAQQVGRKVISTAGSTVNAGSVNLSFTIGEIVVTTESSGELILTQGFQQPDIICNAIATQISTRNPTERCKDGFSQFLTLENTGENIIAGINYTFVVTSLDQTIVQSFSTNLIDLNLLPANSYRIYGVMHENEYSPIPGEKLSESDPQACKRVSANFIPIVFSLPPPEAEINLPSQDTTLCGNPQITLQAEDPLNGTGIWRGSTGLQFSDPFSSRTLLTNLQPGTNTISWQISTPGCPPTSKDAQIFYEPPADPAEIETNSFSVCEPNGHTVQARPPIGDLPGVWSSKNPEVQFSPNTSSTEVTISNLPSDTTVLYWTVGEAPCQTVDSVIIINNQVQSLPQISSPPDTGGVSIICSNQIRLEGNEPLSGELSQWRILNGSGLQFSPGNQIPSPTLQNIPVGEEVQVVYEIVKDACITSSADTLTLFNKGGVSAANILQGDTTLCTGEGLSLAALPASPDEVGFWSTSPLVSVLPGEESPEIRIDSFPVGETEVSWTIQAVDCPDNVAKIIVNIPDPQTPLFAQDTLAICQEDPPFLLEPSIEGLGNIAEFMWSTGDIGSSIEINPAIGSFNTVGLMLLNESGCTFEDEFTLRRDSLDVAIEGTPICLQDNQVVPASLTAQTFGTISQASYTWSNGDRGKTVSIEDPGLYQVITTTTEGCEASAAYEVIQSDFAPSVSPGDTSIILGRQVEMFARGGDTYLWSPEEALTCFLCSDPITSPTENTSYEVVISNLDGCSQTFQFTIEVVDPDAGCETLYIPNILTPGDNGHNDTWVIENLSEENELYLYDRWGGEVFTASPYTNNWDGSKSGGSAFVAQGTYLYVIILGNEQVCRGSITIIHD